MLEDLAKDIRDNITEKLSKPFGGAFVFAWIIHNWVLLYTLFNFDSGTTLNNKTAYIEAYIKEDGWCKLLWVPIMWAFFAIILYLTLTNLSLVISLTFSKYVRPWIYKKMDQYHIVDKKFYDELKDSLRKLQQEKDEAENRLSTLVRDNDKLEKEIKTTTQSNKDLSTSLASVGDDKNRLYDRNEKLERELNSYKQKDKTKLDFENTIGTNIDEIFDGVWQNDFEFADGRTGSERFHVMNSIYYISKKGSSLGEPTFKIANIVIDKNQRLLQFKKLKLDNTFATEDNLVFESDGKLIGFESNGVKVKYTRLPITTDIPKPITP